MGASRNRRFGRYEIIGEVGRGAMGVVYRARDPKINRTVAIKSIAISHHPEEVRKEFRERFLREAEAAGRLSHPGIVTIFDVGEEPDTHDPFLVMEYVSGKSLDAILQEKGKLAPEEAVRLASELAEALDCAHGQDVVHRDLKPANILMTEDGHAKIADFGVAKLNLENLTLHGQILGTPAFMSPEQLNGDKVDGRSDLFSLGVILYTLLTGHRPFQGNSPLTISFKVVNHEPVPVGTFNLQLPPGLDHVLARAIAKDPSQRYQRGMEMSLDLQNVLSGNELWSKTKQPTGKLSVDRRTQQAKSEFETMVGRPLSATVKLWTSSSSWRALPLSLLALGVFTLAWQISSSFLSSGTAPPTSNPPPPQQASVANNVVSVSKPAPAPATSPPHSPPHSPPPQSHPHPQAASVSPEHAATVSIQLENHFSQGNATVWVDDKPMLRLNLQPAAKKKFGIFSGAHNQQTEKLQIASGEHQVRIRVQVSNPFYDQSHTISGNFPEGTERILRVSFTKHDEMTASLK